MNALLNQSTLTSQIVARVTTFFASLRDWFATRFVGFHR
jgi:hypothetical protein